MAYKSPGVYVEEISLFPPSVAEVATAIPAFIGYTDTAVRNGEDLTNKPTRISSLLEYRELFGCEYDPTSVTVKVNDDYAVTDLSLTRFYLYESLRLFFDNGGGPCYIVSVGSYDDTVQNGDPAVANSSGFLVGLAAVQKEDEPTIILFPDAVRLAASDLYTLQQQAIKQCAFLQDRVTIFDLPSDPVAKTVPAFRDGIGINDLKYAAAYVPWLLTTYDKAVPFGLIRSSVSGSTGKLDLATLTSDPELNGYVMAAGIAVDDVAAVDAKVAALRTKDYQTLRDRYATLRNAITGAADDAAAKKALADLLGYVRTIAVDVPTWRGAIKNPGLRTDLRAYAIGKLGAPVQKLIAIEKNDSVRTLAGGTFSNDYKAYDGTKDDTDNKTVGWLPPKDKTKPDSIAVDDIAKTTDDYAKEADGVTVRTPKNSAIAIASAVDPLFKGIDSFVADVQQAADKRAELAETLLYQKHAIIASIVENIKREMRKVPPTGAVAGVYAYVDRTRGVWKAPANVSLASVSGPLESIDNAVQDDLNVDVNAGKSINVIRAFTGRGVIVWGARTLAGNDNEWRYIPVRRFFNMVEESVKKSTAWAVFEPNASPLWTKVKSMIDNYLVQKWREGALAGATPDDAFFVKVGLGQTMTAQDILEGRLFVEIGMAVVRPAEFIILRFMHKMQKS